MPASSARGGGGGGGGPNFRTAGILVLIINWYVISHFIGGQVVTLWQSFKLCHLNFGGERGHTAFSLQDNFTIYFKFLVFYCLVYFYLTTWQKQPLVHIT